MVTIENPIPGKSNRISERTAAQMIQLGSAVVTSRCDGRTLLIRLTGATDAQRRLATVRGYDTVDRMFDPVRDNIPVVQGEKLIRQERSSREFSYVHAVRRRMRPDQDEAAVAAIRRGQDAREGRGGSNPRA